MDSFWNGQPCGGVEIILIHDCVVFFRCEHSFSPSPNPNSDLEGSSVDPDRTEPQSTNAAAAAIADPRILELEMELAKLRQQLAAIVRVQEQGATTGKNRSAIN